MANERAAAADRPLSVLERLSSRRDGQEEEERAWHRSLTASSPSALSWRRRVCNLWRDPLETLMVVTKLWRSGGVSWVEERSRKVR